MLSRILSILLLFLIGVGLLVSWMPESTAWQAFEVSIYVLLVGWLLGWIFGTTGASWSWLFAPFIALICWGPLQIFLHWTIYPFATLTDTLRWGAYAAIFTLAFQTASALGDGRRFSRILTVYSSALTIVCLLQYFMGNGKIFWLFTPGETASGLGPFLNRDHFSTFAILVLPAAAVQIRSRRNGWLFGLAAALLYAAVIAGASRAGFALITVEVILLFVMLNFSGRVASATAACMVAFVFVVGGQTLYERLLAGGQTPGSQYEGRRELALSTLRMIHARPLTGSGLGTWTLLYPSYALKDFGPFINAAHNDWLQWAADGGVLFAGLVLVLFVGAVLLVRRVPWALGVPFVFLHSLIDFPMQGHFLPAVVFLVFGFAARSATESRSGGRLSRDRRASHSDIPQTVIDP